MEYKKSVMTQIRELRERYDTDGQYYEINIKFKDHDIIWLPLSNAINYLGNALSTLEEDYTIVVYRNNAPILFVTNKTEVN